MALDLYHDAVLNHACYNSIPATGKFSQCDSNPPQIERFEYLLYRIESDEKTNRNRSAKKVGI